MSNITNKFNFPQPILNAMRKDHYSRGDSLISATEIIDSPRVRILKKANRENITEDASDKFWSLMGTAIHAIVEQGLDEQHIGEQRYFTEVLGWKISGAVDLQLLGKNPNTGNTTVAVSDYKFTSARNVMNPKADWERQLNVYAWLIEHTTRTQVISLAINGIVRDWTKARALVDPKYPQAPMVVIPLELWPMAQRKKYVYDRVGLHQDTERAHDWHEPIPECTDEERWYQPGQIAIYKEGGKRALKLFESTEIEEAKAYASGVDGSIVQVRPGINTRCLNYCSVSEWCGQWQGIKNQLALDI